MPGLRWGGAILVGLLLAASQPPLLLWWFLPLGVAMLFVLWRRAETVRRAFWTGWLAGTAYFAGTLFWIVEPFLIEPEKFAWMIPVALPGMAGGLALFWGAAFALAKRMGRSEAGLPLAFACCWMLAEGLRGVVLTGFPWAQPGYSLVDVPPIQMAAHLGINGVTFLALLVGAFLGAALVGDGGARRAVCGILAAGLGGGAWLAGAERLSTPIASRTTPLVVGLVQPNVPQSEKWRPDLRDAQLADLIEKTAQLSQAGAQVVIWPEAATPFPLAEMQDLREAIARDLNPGGVLLAGGIRIEGRGTTAQKVHNSLLAIDSEGRMLDSYDKQHLVPFGEYVPFDALLTQMGVRAVISLPGGFSPGAARSRALEIGSLPLFGAMICYEAIFAHEVVDRDSRIEWLVHVTNDAWFGRLSGPQQHLAQVRVRAIERGVPVARAANTGVSAIIDARGRVTRSLHLNTPGILSESLPGRTKSTLYNRQEERPFLMLFLVVIALFAVCELLVAYNYGRYRRS